MHLILGTFILWLSIPSLLSNVIFSSCRIAFDYIHVNATLNTSLNLSDSDTYFAYITYVSVDSGAKPIVGTYCRPEIATNRNIVSVECRLMEAGNGNMYRLTAVLNDTTSVEEIVLDSHYIPQKAAFYCYSDHDLKAIQVVPFDDKLKITWQYKSYDRNYYFYSAQLQIKESNSNLSKYHNVTCDHRTCGGELTGLYPCKTYNVCVFTEYIIGEHRLQCFNGTTTYTVPSPTHLEFDCDEETFMGTLSWRSTVRHGGFNMPLHFFNYVIETEDGFKVSNYTNRTSVTLNVPQNFSAAVKTCSKCGCSPYNRKSDRQCSKTAPKSLKEGGTTWQVLVIPFLVGITLLIIIVSIYRRKTRQSSSAAPVAINPRTPSPIYEEINPYQTYQTVNAHT